MKVLIYGGGAMGLYFAARLRAADHEVVLKARAAAVEAAHGQGVVVETPAGSQRVTGVHPVVKLPVGETFDLVVLTTKSWQVEAAITECLPAIGDHTVVMTVQNGVDAPAVVADHIPAAQVLAATCVVIVQRTGPTSVRLLGAEATMKAGRYTGATTGQESVQVQPVIAAFASAGITVELVADVHRALWKKLALISSYGGIGAMCSVPVGVTRAHVSSRDLVSRAVAECAAVARAKGITFTKTDESEVMDIYLNGFDPSTTSSMQRDLTEGRPSELMDQNGAVTTHVALTPDGGHGVMRLVEDPQSGYSVASRTRRG